MLSLLLFALVVVVLSSCRVDTTVTIDVEADGSGTVKVDVVVDRAAADLLGDPKGGLRLEDLVEAGWTVDDPVRDDDTGGLSISAGHDFRSGDDLARLLGTLGVGRGTASADDSAGGGPSGNTSEGSSDQPVGFVDGVRLRITNSSSRTDYDFDASLRIPPGLGSLSDPELTEVLDGLPVGRTPEELEAMGYDPTRGIGDLRIRLRLPGEVETTTGRADGRYVEWSSPLGSTEAVDQQLRQKNVVEDRRPTTFRAIALGALVVAVALGVVGIVRRR